MDRFPQLSTLASRVAVLTCEASPSCGLTRHTLNAVSVGTVDPKAARARGRRVAVSVTINTRPEVVKRTAGLRWHGAVEVLYACDRCGHVRRYGLLSYGALKRTRAPRTLRTCQPWLSA
jgi:hypothetical protein